MRGHLDAQIGANVLGAERLVAFADAPVDEVVDYGERRMRAALAAMPDGSWTFEDEVDGSMVRLTLTIAGDAATFDFTGSAAGCVVPARVLLVIVIVGTAIAALVTFVSAILALPIPRR